MAKAVTLSRFKTRRNLRINPLDCPTCHNPENTHDDFYWGQHGNKVEGECKKCLKKKREQTKADKAIGFFDEKEFAKSMLL